MSCDCANTGLGNCTCGCCTGVSVATPVAEYNPPGLPAISYRTGTWATFNQSMLARLSSGDYPALAGLRTRSNDDYSIALLDASAVVLDILTFYQERLANESYLGTATQLYSLMQLGRLIGYQPSPGVSASVYLAFNLSAAPGLPPNPNNTAISIPAGTTVQSVPAQGQKPQTFQTSAVILAKPDWNALQVQTGIPWVPQAGDTSVYLQGASTQLSPGDAILIVGDERLTNPDSLGWDLCHIVSVQPDPVNKRTLITWAESEKLGSAPPGQGPSQENPQVFALRQRASLFGFNAMNPNLLHGTASYPEIQDQLTGDGGDWSFGTAFNSVPADLAANNLIDLDAVYSKLTAGGWLVIMANYLKRSFETGTDPSGTFLSGTTIFDRNRPKYTTALEMNLYNLTAVTTVSRSDYGLSARITRAQADISSTEDQNTLGLYYSRDTRSAAVLTQSELLPVCEQPLDYPLYGTIVDLETVRDDLSAIQAIAVTGSNPQLIVTVDRSGNTANSVSFSPYDGKGSATFGPGSTFTLMQPPQTVFKPDGSIPDWSTLTDPVQLVVTDANGRLGTVEAALSIFTVMPSASNSPIVQEVALVSSISQLPATQNTTAGATVRARTRIVLANPLLNCYDRTVTTINANVGQATGGSGVVELLGNGAAATPNQTFQLKQNPLTYTQAPTPSGSESSLSVSVNGAAWELVPTLYNQSPQAQAFTTVGLTGGKTQVIFGDGVEGSTIPTGQNNIIANYRVGLGLASNVGAGTITTLVDRPVGVSGVTNPSPATGGQDAASVSEIQVLAPMSVQTLGRAVSINDYQNFAATFAGIAKASALWFPSGFYRGVFITVAAAGGAGLIPPNPTLSNLTTSLQTSGIPGVAVRVFTFYETLFRLNASIAYDPAYNAGAVNTAVMALLNSSYSFANRTFGQGVSGDELAALIQTVAGVVGVNVTGVEVVASSLAGDLGAAGYSVANWQAWIQKQRHLKRPCSGSKTAICPYIPQPQKHCLPCAAEILVISPNPSDVVLKVMS